MNNVICQNKFLDKEHCGWIHFKVDLPYVLNWEADWNIYWETLDERGRDMFGCVLRPPRIEDNYLTCNRCGGSYKNFRDATDEEYDKIYGSTISGILDRTVDFEVRDVGPRRKND
jgi:hypothetical protein